jgi:putative methyltransferase (TIGR04325 family)
MQLKEFLPPVIVRGLSRVRPAKYGWFGDYASWQEALNNSSGYAEEAIAAKVLDAARKVKEGRAAFERDSVTFDKMDYPWPVLSSILWAAASKGKQVTVMDFGGSLGSTYYALRRFLSDLDVRWHVVEQERFVKLGKDNFEDNRLKFFLTPNDCLSKGPVDVILLSSVLPYLQEPYKVLEELIGLSVPYIVFDKMPFLSEGNKDRLTVQRVNPAIYSASYPAWFFEERKFLRVMEKQYEQVAEFSNSDIANIPSVFKGFIYRRRS